MQDAGAVDADFFVGECRQESFEFVAESQGEGERDAVGGGDGVG